MDLFACQIILKILFSSLVVNRSGPYMYLVKYVRLSTFGETGWGAEPGPDK